VRAQTLVDVLTRWIAKGAETPPAGAELLGAAPGGPAK